MNPNEKIVADYIKNTENLCTSIEKWLLEKSFSCEKGVVEIFEEFSDKYNMKKLVVKDRDNHEIAELVPVGARIIGAGGRLDLIGKLDKQILLYLETGKQETGISEKNSGLYKGVTEDGWYWVEDNRLGRAHFLDKELFFDLLAEVSDYEF